MERLGPDMERQLGRFDGRGAMPRIVSLWPAAVGDEVARNAWPARVARDGTLHVHTSSSVWAFELGQLAPQILARLRAELGDAAPTGLRFTQGHLPEPAPPPPELPPPATSRVSAEAAEQARALAAPIGDEELRKRVERAASLGLSACADGRSL